MVVDLIMAVVIGGLIGYFVDPYFGWIAGFALFSFALIRTVWDRLKKYWDWIKTAFVFVVTIVVSFNTVKRETKIRILVHFQPNNPWWAKLHELIRAGLSYDEEEKNIAKALARSHRIIDKAHRRRDRRGVSSARGRSLTELKNEKIELLEDIEEHTRRIRDIFDNAEVFRKGIELIKRRNVAELYEDENRQQLASMSQDRFKLIQILQSLLLHMKHLYYLEGEIHTLTSQSPLREDSRHLQHQLLEISGEKEIPQRIAEVLNPQELMVRMEAVSDFFDEILQNEQHHNSENYQGLHALSLPQLIRIWGYPQGALSRLSEETAQEFEPHHLIELVTERFNAAKVEENQLEAYLKLELKILELIQVKISEQLQLMGELEHELQEQNQREEIEQEREAQQADPQVSHDFYEGLRNVIATSAYDEAEDLLEEDKIREGAHVLSKQEHSVLLQLVNYLQGETVEDIDYLLAQIQEEQLEETIRMHAIYRAITSLINQSLQSIVQVVHEKGKGSRKSTPLHSPYMISEIVAGPKEWNSGRFTFHNFRSQVSRLHPETTKPLRARMYYQQRVAALIRGIEEFHLKGVGSAQELENECNTYPRVLRTCLKSLLNYLIVDTEKNLAGIFIGEEFRRNTPHEFHLAVRVNQGTLTHTLPEGSVIEIEKEYKGKPVDLAKMVGAFALDKSHVENEEDSELLPVVFVQFRRKQTAPEEPQRRSSVDIITDAIRLEKYDGLVDKFEQIDMNEKDDEKAKGETQHRFSNQLAGELKALGFDEQKYDLSARKITELIHGVVNTFVNFSTYAVHSKEEINTNALARNKLLLQSFIDKYQDEKTELFVELRLKAIHYLASYALLEKAMRGDHWKLEESPITDREGIWESYRELNDNEIWNFISTGTLGNRGAPSLERFPSSLHYFLTSLMRRVVFIKGKDHVEVYVDSPRQGRNTQYLVYVQNGTTQMEVPCFQNTRTPYDFGVELEQKLVENHKSTYCFATTNGHTRNPFNRIPIYNWIVIDNWEEETGQEETPLSDLGRGSSREIPPIEEPDDEIPAFLRRGPQPYRGDDNDK